MKIVAAIVFIMIIVTTGAFTVDLINDVHMTVSGNEMRELRENIITSHVVSQGNRDLKVALLLENESDYKIISLYTTVYWRHKHSSREDAVSQELKCSFLGIQPSTSGPCESSYDHRYVKSQWVLRRISVDSMRVAI